jgi:amino acid transporter
MLSKVRSWKQEAGSWKREVGRNKTKIVTLFFVFCFLFFGISSYGQCAMCRAALETEGNAVKSQAVNDGIVYLMVIPYVLVAGIGYYIYRMKKKKSN